MLAALCSLKAGPFIGAPRYNFHFMREIVIALALLIVAAAPPVCAQQATSATQGPAAGPVYNDVAYGVAGGQTLLLDIFEPANNSGKPRPAVVLVHGGGWTSFDKSTMLRLAQFLALAGFVAVPVDYRLYHDDATRWPAQLDDVQRAVRWLRANSAKYNLDPQRIGAYGHSSGAQLALLLGMVETRDNSDATLAKYYSKVQAVVDASGPSDFTEHVNGDDAKFLTSFFGADFAAHPEIWREASPIFHVAKSDAPILIIHGTRDDSVPIAQAEALNDALRKAGATVQFLRLDSDHMFHDPASHRQLALETQAFFDRYLAATPK
jgi:acetyl esterase/lipase